MPAHPGSPEPRGPRRERALSGAFSCGRYGRLRRRRSRTFSALWLAGAPSLATRPPLFFSKVCPDPYTFLILRDADYKMATLKLRLHYGSKLSERCNLRLAVCDLRATEPSLPRQELDGASTAKIRRTVLFEGP